MTARESTQHQLQASESRYRRLFEAARDGILILNALTLEITDVNPFMTEFLGYTRNEFLGKQLWEIGLFRDKAASEAAFQELQSTGYLRYDDLPLQTTSGEIREVEFVSNVYEEDGVDVIQCNIRDITTRKCSEEKLQQSQKLEAIGTLAGGIAHDFNNILGAIIGYSEMAAREIPRDSTAQHHIRQVLIASARAMALVRQILTFSRQKESRREAMKLQPVIEETVKLLKASLSSAIEVHQDIDAAAPQLLGDYTQLQQVIINLCTNGARAMRKDGGILEISLTVMTINADFTSAHPEVKEGPHLCLTVSDTGCGMDRATQDRMFEPFFTTSAPGEGTGLGLAVVHGVIKNHGGAITVYSEPEVGTSINIYLPVLDTKPVDRDQASIYTPPGHGERILFVDDEEALVLLGKSTLEHLGYRVLTMTDSVKALAVFRSRPHEFDLVITDQTMPQLNGADLAKALLEIRPELPIVLSTGYTSQGTMNPEKANALGIRELLFKPNTLQALAEAIQRALVHRSDE
jgi:PAS domain S-box-containing protein